MDCRQRLDAAFLVNAEYPGVILPNDFIENGRIVLNIRPEAIQGLLLGNEEIQFNARFSGRAMRIVAPTKAILAIYAKENGKGMILTRRRTMTTKLRRKARNLEPHKNLS